MVPGGKGEVAQLVEHGTHNPGVAGSIPALTTNKPQAWCLRQESRPQRNDSVIKVLKVDAAGTPQDWLHHEDAAKAIVSGDVTWSVGPVLTRLRGGWNQRGERSFVDIPAVIGTRGCADINLAACVPALGRHNSLRLFERDQYLCAYCGTIFHSDKLTRDHVMPLSRGGKDEWTNVVTACGRCNSHKGALTPEEAGMPLLYVPYTPNWFEDLILRQGPHRILADQMEFLRSRIPANSRFRKLQ